MTRELHTKELPEKFTQADQELRLVGLKRRFPNTRLARLAVGAAIVLLAAWAYLPRLLFPISSNAVINGHVVTLRAPIGGEVLAMPSAAGRAVAKDEVLVRLGNPRIDNSQLAALRAQQATLREKIGAIQHELAQLKDLERRLNSDSGVYRDAVGARYEALLAEADARLAARRAVATEAAAALQRQQALYAKRLTTLAALDAAERTETVARAELHEAERAVERIRVEQRSAAQGIYFGDGYNNVPYTQQRSDEIQLRMQALQSALSDTRSRLRETERQAALEQQRLERLESAALAAPAAGRVWLELAAHGEYVSAGAPLLQILDSSRLFLMVSLDERYFDDIAVGDPAVVELVGAADALQGRVERVQGNEAKVDDLVLAVAPPPVKPREFRVVVALDMRGFADGADAYNHVGRRAKVSFRKGPATGTPPA